LLPEELSPLPPEEEDLDLRTAGLSCLDALPSVLTFLAAAGLAFVPLRLSATTTANRIATDLGDILRCAVWVARRAGSEVWGARERWSTCAVEPVSAESRLYWVSSRSWQPVAVPCRTVASYVQAPPSGNWMYIAVYCRCHSAVRPRREKSSAINDLVSFASSVSGHPAGETWLRTVPLLLF
jgi:hypothetical protein